MEPKPFKYFPELKWGTEPSAAEPLSKVEQPPAALDARIQKITESDEARAPAETRVARLDGSVFDAMTQLEEILTEFRGQRDRIAPALAEATRLAEVVSGVEQRIATLRDQELSLLHTADRIAPALAEADRLADVVSGVEQRIATLHDREPSLFHARPVVEEPDRAVEAALLPLQVSVDTARLREDRSGLGGLRGIIGRHAVAASLLGLLAVVAVGGLVARRPRVAVPAPTTQHTSEGHVAAASIPPSPIPPSPIPVAATAPTTPGILPAAIKSASGTSRSSKVTTRQRTRSRQPVRNPSPPPVFAGDLAVQSNPAGGTVFIDRQRVGETPLRLSRLTAGSHVVWIESDGHARWTAAVQVNSDKLVRVNATLEPRR